MNRRSFLRAAALLSAGAAGAASPGLGAPVRIQPGAAPSARPQTPGQLDRDRARRAALRALDTARRLGATHAEVRIVRLRDQLLRVEDDRLAGLSDEESYGAAVRVIAGGAFGFCAAPRIGDAELEGAAARAVEIAKLAASAGARAPVLAPVAPAPNVQTRWVAPFQLDPFALPLEQKIEALLGAARAARAVKAAGAQLQVAVSLRLLREEKTLYTSQGSIIEQLIVRTAPRITVRAVDRARGQLDERRSDGDLPARAVGWEYLAKDRLAELAPRLAEDALRALRGREAPAGPIDLILHPSHLDGIIHGTIARATALRRVLGEGEGGSFLTLPNLGRLQLAAPGVSFIADRTQREGLATTGYDDDGDAAQRFYLVQRGKLVAYQGSRAQAAALGDRAGTGGHACAIADSFSDEPAQGLPNVSLEAGAEALSLADLISDSKRAIYIEGRGALSADPLLRRFQVEGGAAWLIEDGKKKTPLRRLRYESATLAFWRACDRLCGAAEYHLGGVLPDAPARGDGESSFGSSHGCVPARFRGVTVLGGAA